MIRIYLKIKKLLDKFLSLIGLIILAPLLLILVLVIKVDSKGPVLFKQKRIGKNKKHFQILKFRTMYRHTPEDTPTHLLDNPDRWITRSGKFLRKTSLDELPQIINVLKGDMSIVGPRPALWNQYDLMRERDRYGANDILPGITGWAQINGRDELEISEKAKLDGEYLEKMSLTMDLKCLIGTFLAVFKNEGLLEGKQKKGKEERDEKDSNHREE